MIAILAGNYSEYRNWLKRNFPHEDPIRTRTFVYAYSQVKIMGMHIHAIIEIGSAYRRDDYIDIRRELHMRMAVNRGRGDGIHQVS